MNSQPVVTLAAVRRLAVAKQRLAGARPAADAAGILDLVRDLGCLQLDPTSAVERSHWLVLWSRLGAFERAHLDQLLWQERRLFEYWAHAASIVLTEDYPIHHLRMRGYAKGDGAWLLRTREWTTENRSLRRHVLTRLRRDGPLRARDIEDNSVSPWRSSGWSGGRNVDRMIGFLWTKGKIMVAGRAGGQKLWDMSERCLPDWTPREHLPNHEIVRRAAQRSLRALGVATAKQIEWHYTRFRYPGLPRALAELESEGLIQRAQVQANGGTWPGGWYIHAEDAPLLERLQAGDWQPRTTLLSPFDNLICDRERTEQLFNFRFRIEIYVPKAKRQYGYYVLPILRGDRLIGRVDPLMNRARKRLTINAVHAEPDAPMTKSVAREIAGSIESLAAFLGAREIVYGENVPAGWRSALR